VKALHIPGLAAQHFLELLFGLMCLNVIHSYLQLLGSLSNVHQVFQPATPIKNVGFRPDASAGLHLTDILKAAKNCEFSKLANFTTLSYPKF
jgi:hypothetical protein